MWTCFVREPLEPFPWRQACFTTRYGAHVDEGGQTLPSHIILLINFSFVIWPSTCPLTSRQRQSCHHSRFIPLKASYEAVQFTDGASSHGAHPGVEVLASSCANDL